MEINMYNTNIPLSVLDLGPVADGFSISQAIENTTKLAIAVE